MNDLTRWQGAIHSETFGTGPDIVFVHGWSMHSGVWRGFAQRLAAEFRVTLLDLPGHGRSGMVEDFSLDGWAAALLAAAPARAHWLGWSLGAEIALSVASRNPARVASLTMLAGNARFARAEDWPCGMDLAVLAQFADNMIADYRGTMLKFLGLQTWGLDNAREVLRDLRAQVAECGAPAPAALRAGLEILRTADLRGELAALPVPLLILLGGRDRLASPAAGAAMQALAPQAELHILDHAAHTPFISHGDACAHLLADFWRRHAY